MTALLKDLHSEMKGVQKKKKKESIKGQIFLFTPHTNDISLNHSLLLQEVPKTLYRMVLKNVCIGLTFLFDATVRFVTFNFIVRI